MVDSDKIRARHHDKGTTVKRVLIQDKLTSIDVDPKSISLGEFDYIGEFTAKRERKPGDLNYHSVGAFYRANYERGILIYNLIKQYRLSSMLEIGFGRGYATFCAAKAFYDAGIMHGKITTIDPALDQNYLNALQRVFPREWFSFITFIKGSSAEVVPTLKDRFDLVYIDGDHSYSATKTDWENVKLNFDKFCLFDDYHMPSKTDKGTIECSRLIDQIDASSVSCDDPELIILDRRMFFDDRRKTDDEIDYGQVLFTKRGTSLHNDW